MPFTGKATFSAGATLPEIAEDVGDLISINSPHETPLLDALGDASRTARSTVHEWLEDTLLLDNDLIDTVSASNVLVMQHVDRFRVGDLIRFDTSGTEVALVVGIDPDSSSIQLTRGYGGTSTVTVTAGQRVHVIGNASLEGADAADARFTVRTRQQNYTQIFTATVSVSGSELAANQIAVRDELAWQKNLRSRELLRDLENSVINGVASAATPAGSGSVRRTMRGLISFAQTNRFVVGQNGFPADTALSETQLNLALREIWKTSSGQVDLIVVGGREKRAINAFIAADRRFYPQSDSYRDMVSVYESDFGVCRVVLSRHVPTGSALLLDSTRIGVMPLSGRSFQYTPLARTGDAENGQLVGEYTVECRNEAAHGLIRGFTA
ncbi:MAG TPA: DUF5309 family protein [Tepidisphaeraceae bacterium]|jgi:hypothetical protein